MIPADVRLPCQDDPTKWDVPASVETREEALLVRHVVSEALRICRTECPVARECYLQAVADPPAHQVMGARIWTQKRQPIRFKDWDVTVRQPQPCGSHAAYVRHVNNGEAPCDECRKAEAKYSRGRKHSNRTHCPQGHEYTDDNTFRDARGARVCRTCRPEWGRAA